MTTLVEIIKLMIKCNVKHLNVMNNLTFVMNGGHWVPQPKRTKNSRELPLKTNIVHEDKWEEKHSKSNDRKHYSCIFDGLQQVQHIVWYLEFNAFKHVIKN